MNLVSNNSLFLMVLFGKALYDYNAYSYLRKLSLQVLSGLDPHSSIGSETFS